MSMTNGNRRLDEVFSSQSKYCYPNTDVLINKLNIQNQEDLDRAERSLTLLRLTNLQMYGIPNYSFEFTVDYYLAIHQFLFQDLYDFAGKIRSENITKGSTPFCRPEFIYNYLDSLLKEMYQKVKFIKTKEDLLHFLAYYYAEINVVHPFREGNGRVLREFLRQSVKHINKIQDLHLEIDYSLTDDQATEDLMNGSIASAMMGNIDLLKSFFNKVTIEKELEKERKR